MKFFFPNCNDDSASVVIFHYSIFGCGNNWKLLQFRHLWVQAYISFSLVACKTKEFKFVRLVYSCFFTLETLVIGFIPCKSCILAKVSKLCLRRCMFAFWWNVAS